MNKQYFVRVRMERPNGSGIRMTGAFSIPAGSSVSFVDVPIDLEHNKRIADLERQGYSRDAISIHAGRGIYV